MCKRSQRTNTSVFVIPCSLRGNVPVPLVCLAVPLQRSEVIESVAGTAPSLAQGSTGPPEEEVLGGTGVPQGSALGGVTATREGRRCRGGEG